MNETKRDGAANKMSSKTKKRHGVTGGDPGPGRVAGSRNPRTLESIAKNRERIYAAVLASALAGDGECARLCLELIGDLPRSKDLTLQPA